MARSLQRYAWISIGAAIVTIALKGGAYLLTGSVGVLSDALESLVNLTAAIFALFALMVAARPPDDEHEYGHSKAEYLSSGFEGALILLAAGSILYTAVRRLIEPRPLDDLGIGVAITLVATLLNYAVARLLQRGATEYRSIALEADARHLMTDVWTSVGVVAGLGLVAVTGWQRLDSLVAILVAGHVMVSGVGLLRRTAHGVLDTALPAEERATILAVLEARREAGVEYHALRTRQAGARRFVSFHVLVPGRWSVQRGHDLLEAIEEAVREALPGSTVFTHLEPLEDPVSFQDTRLERPPPDSPADPGPDRDAPAGV